MKSKASLLLVLFVVQLMRTMAGAQTNQQAGASTDAASVPDEKKLGSFVVKQTFEFGYRAVDVSSQKLSPSDPTNFAMYDTFVNLQTGPRLLEQTLSLQSPDHNGLLFDDLFVSSFGFGGDPNNVARATATKYNWYDFNLLFRRDQNFFDYNLLANPLNPPDSSPAIPITFSPHRYATVRRMSDLNLTVKPQSRLSLRLGYNRNSWQGPSFTTIPEASEEEIIETVLVQRNNVITDQYQVGVDFKFLPRTTISYDQFVAHTKYGTSWNDESFSWVLPNGTPADLGIAWNTQNGQPCATPFVPGPPVVDPTCSLYLAYSRSNPERTNAPTEQLSFHSSYFSRLDLTGKVSYSSANMTSAFSDFFNGFLADLGTRQFATAGPINGKRISVNTDLGVTLFVTGKLRINDRFRFYNFRIPTSWNSTTQTWAGTSALDPVGPTPDSVDNIAFTRFLGEDTKSNQIEVEYNFSKRFGGRAGYRFQNSLYRHIGANTDLSTGDVETDSDIVPVNFHTALFGLWTRPSEKLRANVDVELTTADNFLTRISPRRSLEYRARASYKPIRGITLAATSNIHEARNGVQEISYNAHNRNFGFTATANRNARLGIELAYNYTNAASNSFLCFQASASPLPGNSFSCATDTGGAVPFEIYENYSNRSHFGTATVLLKPVKQLTTNVGYSIVSANGDATILNQLQPFGTLKSNYHRPLADVEFELARGWTAIARWNYYEYREKTPFFGPTYPRNFHANATTLSLRYAF
jgi:hypothetical protein